MKQILGEGEFYGQKQQSLDASSGRFTEMFYTPSFRIPSHSHKHAFFGLVLEGSYTERYEGHRRECHSGSFLFHPEGEEHSEVHDDVSVCIFSFEPSPKLLEEIREKSRQLRDPFECRGGLLARLALQLHREFRDPDAFSSLAMEGLALEHLATVCRHQSEKGATPPRWLRRIHDLIHERFIENLSLREISDYVGIHPTHVARAFRRHYGCTVGDYIRGKRLAKARHDLTATNAPLSEIALAAGYSDQSHFSNAFKRQNGITPGQFRKSLQRR